ncbi:TetR/AcrR family transcriptional regulator [Actimicrobium sp. CCI2.3]|uniref:TetR/AcrR family transcriptional regulator n=1 Tax=Actimicrobium sp. CCI2.3 TaxID=3048616 RepID=UPI002AB47668|nr:TetR family transcriptional regulator [Actimicrobium sp. CCI2.3]MDY7574266.1 TetR family transcriptional regulator [Actimicrobium sp. CCI2.3]MEB0022734.1 TetR family transcriptional regulator [Actimicrobium sp. CCI2.3]
MIPVQKLTFKQQQLLVREAAIIHAVHGLLARKGYDLMTMDEVAAEVGIAKASLYKHFSSKESLAAAAMIRLIENTLAHVRALPSEMPAIDQLRGILRWALEVRLQGGLPMLPSDNKFLRDSLLDNPKYISRVMDLNELLAGLIEAARAAGELHQNLPVEVILLTIYARSCDPSVDYLKMMGVHSDAQIVDFMLATCFGGLSAISQSA